MRRNLLTLIFSLTCVFLLTGSLFAETKISSKIWTEVSNNSNVVKNNTLRNTAIAKYEKLKQLCEASATWDCLSALQHSSNTWDTVFSLCEGEGWGSQTCADYVDWGSRTNDWATTICNNPQQATIRAKPQIAIARSHLKNT